MWNKQLSLQVFLFRYFHFFGDIHFGIEIPLAEVKNYQLEKDKYRIFSFIKMASIKISLLITEQGDCN
ncbi:hypothetical protein DF185_07590 [Marinifilum breve]|uniref:Uncharacterized protein n=1 Tax=Marinifilum breve TaxID=2184082 RepID=A0A2V3ZY44_9BACT|nr:hypothetical protein DF185_07590 [Marinifilum breve]